MPSRLSFTAIYLGLASGASEGGCHHEAVFRRNCFTREWSLTCTDDYFVTRLRKSCSRASSGAIHHAQKLATGAYPAYLAPPSAMTQDACVAACEALPACKAWSYRTGNPEHVHYRKCFLLGVSSAKYAVTPDSNFESGVCTDGTVSDAPIGAVCNPIGLFGWATSEPRFTDATMGCNGAAASEVPPPCYAGMPCLQNRGSPRWKECEKWNWEDSFCAPGFWAEEQSLDTYPNALDAATKTVQVPTVRGSPGAPISTWAELDSARQEWDCAGKEEHKAFGCIEAPARSPCRRCGASRHGSMLLATEAYKFIQKTYQFAHLRKTVRSPYYGLDGAERCAACPPGEKAAPSDGQADGEDGAYFACKPVVCPPTHRLDIHVLKCKALPIDGAWTDWGTWSSCSKTCGAGEQTRSRTCTDPPPQHGGAECSGSEIAYRHCHDTPCCAAGTRNAGDACEPCSTGRYQKMANQLACEACVPGSHQNLQGQISCKDCAAGRAAASPATVHCANCAAGTYQSSAGASTCAACMPGQFMASKGGSSCATCAAGQYQDQSGATGCKTCVAAGEALCPRGHEHNERCGPSSPGKCVSCSKGRAKFVSSGLDATSDRCRACTTGQYQHLEGSHACEKCPSGHFQDEDEATACKACDYSCAAGLFHAACGGSSRGLCVACAAGQYAPDGPTKNCWLCKPGSFTESEGYGQCDTCNGVTEWQDGHGAKSCKPVALCATFEYEAVAPTKTSNRVCRAVKDCPHGTWESRSPGPKNDRECTVWRVCATFEFEAQAGHLHADRTCHPHSAECPDGHWESVTPGKFQDRECSAHTLCDLSTHWESLVSGPMHDRKCSRLTICGPGSREAAAPTETSDRWCALCPEGSYKPTAGNERACFRCPDGYAARPDRKACVAVRCSHVHCKIEEHQCSRFGSSHFPRTGHIGGVAHGVGDGAVHVDAIIKGMFNAEECDGRTWRSIRVFHHGREHQCATSRGGHMCATGAVSGDKTKCECKPRTPVPDYASLQGDTTQSGCDWSVSVGRSDQPGKVVREVETMGEAGDTFKFEGCSSMHFMALACAKKYGPNSGVGILRRYSKENKFGPIVGTGSCCTHQVACGHAFRGTGECGMGRCRGGYCVCAQGWATINAKHPCASQDPGLVGIEHARSVVISSTAQCHPPAAPAFTPSASQEWQPALPWQRSEAP
jgi:hypothetical protein